jgi:hypothetical protein
MNNQTREVPESAGMTRFFGQMLKLPLAAFTYSMDVFARTMGGMQKVAEEGIDLMLGVMVKNLNMRLGQTSFTGQAGWFGGNGLVGDGAENNDQPSSKEEKKMWDKDSWESDLKVVRYWVLFDKRDYETIFSSGEIEPELSNKGNVELVLGRKTIEEFRGEKRSKFKERLGSILRPQKWKDREYPQGEEGDHMAKLDGNEFDEYVQVIVEVIHQQARRDRDYEKDKVQLLGGINRSINRVGDDISAKIG